jgi:RNA methyltransferase, TrmH family
MNEVIVSKDNAKVKAAFKAMDGKGEVFLVEGFHLVEMALEAHAAEMVFSLKEYPCAAPVYQVSKAIIKKLASTPNPEGIVALCHKKPCKSPVNSRLLYLDEIADPGNVGTLLRTALSFGFTDVILSKGTAEAYASKVLLASQGAIFKLNVSESRDDPLFDLQKLKQEGYFLLGTDLQSSVPLASLAIPQGKIALLLGNEARGVRKDLLGLCEQRVRIEMGGIDSLNVGVAGGIVMYALREKNN